MKKSKLVYVIIIIALMLMMSGCKKPMSADDPKDFTASPSPTSAITEAPNIPATIVPSATPAIAPTTMPTEISDITFEELSLEAYERFMRNETKLSFDRYMQTDYREEALYKKGGEYTLSEVLDIVTAYYFEHSENKKIDYIDYSYIDCGKDGVNELVLRFNGMDIYNRDDDSTLVYIIKYIDDKLSLCYYYETWARSDSTINQYGFYVSGGSNGASNYGMEYGLIDKEGNWQSIVYMESEADLYQLTYLDGLEQLPSIAEARGSLGNIELVTIRFHENDAPSAELGNPEYFYTFYVYDDNWNQIEDEHLYTNSIYKEIFEEASVAFITPEEVSALISEKEEMVGATDEIKEGAEISWKTLGKGLYYEYVGR